MTSSVSSPSTTAAADARINARHPFAAHLRRTAAAQRSAPHRSWTPADGPLPSLYVSHGATGILIVSAHWEAAPTMLSASSPRELVYDFGGFDPMYHRMRYDTPSATELARCPRTTLGACSTWVVDCGPCARSGVLVSARAT